MRLQHLIHNTKKFGKANSPEILTGLGVAGVLTSSYFSAKGGYQAAQRMEYEQPDLTLKEKARIVWKCYIPAAAANAVTIGCIVASNRAGSNKTAAAVTAYSLTEKAFSEYKEKVTEEIGKAKEQKIRDDIAEEKLKGWESCSREVIIAGGGDVLCCELMTGRYFRSDMERLKKAENAINHRVVHEMYVTLDEFYDLVGLPHTSVSDHLGWTSTKLLDIHFTSALNPSGEPCLAFDYNYTGPV